jgi:eight-cysteine-cluster-containing protein
MRSALILALAVACSSPQSSTEPAPDNTADPAPDPGAEPAPPQPPAPEAGRTPAVSPDHPLYARVEGSSSPGECADDSACVTGGCSAEVCSTEQVQTTCEARDWPTAGASCGCVSGQCVWYTGGSEDSGGDSSNEGVVKEFETIKTEMCACRDKACAEQVNKSFEEWLVAHEKAKGSKGEQERAKKIAEEYVKCMMVAMAGAPDQGETCGPGDKCGDGLTCMKYYGVAGAAGPQLSSCEIPCGKGKPACPAGQTCQIVADGPGQVCRK